MLRIAETIIVEGKFDKARIKRVTDAPVLSVGGFGVYSDKSLIASIRALARTTGIIVLTDADGAGFRIRGFIKSCVGTEGVKHAYIPSVAGKERRKRVGGKEGLLGVEGISDETLRAALLAASPSLCDTADTGGRVTKAVLYEDGFAGRADSRERRAALCAELRLPRRTSANAMLDVINGAFGYEEYKRAAARIAEK